MDHGYSPNIGNVASTIVHDCLDILDVDVRILIKVYQLMTTDADVRECCRLLMYKYNSICINANNPAGNKKDATVRAYRDAVTFEMQSPEQMHWIWMLEAFYDNPTPVSLERLD